MEKENIDVLTAALCIEFFVVFIAVYSLFWIVWTSKTLSYAYPFFPFAKQTLVIFAPIFMTIVFSFLTIVALKSFGEVAGWYFFVFIAEVFWLYGLFRYDRSLTVDVAILRMHRGEIRVETRRVKPMGTAKLEEYNKQKQKIMSLGKEGQASE